jgi:hypothetical protein
MELTPEVVSACVALAESDAAVKGIIIPEESFGEGFWAQCKRLEKSFYVGVDWMEAARFYDAGVFRSVGGYSETMVSGEDWDLSHRVKDTYGAGRISEMIRHNEGRISLLETVRTKFYYAQRFSRYMQSHAKRQEATRQTGVLERFGLFFRHPGQLFRNPFVGVGMLFMKGCEFGFGAVGYVLRNWRAA